MVSVAGSIEGCGKPGNAACMCRPSGAANKVGCPGTSHLIDSGSGDTIGTPYGISPLFGCCCPKNPAPGQAGERSGSGGNEYGVPGTTVSPELPNSDVGDGWIYCSVFVIIRPAYA